MQTALCIVTKIYCVSFSFQNLYVETQKETLFCDSGNGANINIYFIVLVDSLTLRQFSGLHIRGPEMCWFKFLTYNLKEKRLFSNVSENHKIEIFKNDIEKTTHLWVFDMLCKLVHKIHKKKYKNRANIVRSPRNRKMIKFYIFVRMLEYGIRKFISLQLKKDHLWIFVVTIFKIEQF